MLLTVENVRACNLEGKFKITLDGNDVDLNFCVKAQDGDNGFVVVCDNPPKIVDGEIEYKTMTGNVEIILDS